MTQPTLPQHASVVVIGGGIMGCSTLYHLARAGVSDCILLERNRLTSGTTWHSAAQVRALRSTWNLTELIRYSISLYSELERETGQAAGWINKGSLSIATSKDRLIHIRRQEALAHLYGVRAEFLCAGEALERWPTALSTVIPRRICMRWTRSGFRRASTRCRRSASASRKRWASTMPLPFPVCSQGPHETSLPPRGSRHLHLDAQ